MMRKNHIRGLVSLALCALMSASFGTVVDAQKEQSIAVIVNNDPITNYDITQRMRLVTVTQRKQPTEALRKSIIEDLISERIQLQAATKSGISIGEEQVNELFSNVAKSNKMTANQFSTALGQLGVNTDTMKEQIRARLAWRQVIPAKFRGQVSINASQVDAAISTAEPTEGAKQQTEFQLQRVRLEISDQNDQRDVARRLVEAERLRARIRSCTNIEQVVRPLRKTSVKAVARQSSSQLPQPTRAVLMASDEGQATPATITSSGVELYVVCAKRTVARNDQQRREVRQKLVTEEYGILARRYLRDLRQEAFVEYR